MNIINPNDKDSSINDLVCESCALTLLLDKDDNIYDYEGKAEEAAFIQSSYRQADLRRLISDKKKRRFKKEVMTRWSLLLNFEQIHLLKTW